MASQLEDDETVAKEGKTKAFHEDVDNVKLSLAVAQPFPCRVKGVEFILKRSK